MSHYNDLELDFIVILMSSFDSCGRAMRSLTWPKSTSFGAGEGGGESSSFLVRGFLSGTRQGWRKMGHLPSTALVVLETKTETRTFLYIEVERKNMIILLLPIASV